MPIAQDRRVSALESAWSKGRCLNNGSGCIGGIGREEVLRAGVEMLSAGLP
jgi:hypothetical protein